MKLSKLVKPNMLYFLPHFFDQIGYFMGLKAKIGAVPRRSTSLIDLKRL